MDLLELTKKCTCWGIDSLKKLFINGIKTHSIFFISYSLTLQCSFHTSCSLFASNELSERACQALCYIQESSNLSSITKFLSRSVGAGCQFCSANSSWSQSRFPPKTSSSFHCLSLSLHLLIAITAKVDERGAPHVLLFPPCLFPDMCGCFC